MSDRSADAGTTRVELLLQAALALTGEHDVDVVLERIVQSAAQLAGARFAALGIYEDGRICRFVHRGLDEVTVVAIGELPSGRGLLGEVITASGPIRLADLCDDSRAVGFPPHHPVMHSLLGVPVAGAAGRYGNLYVTEKHEGGSFSDDDEHLLVVLAAFAAAAIESAELVAAERRRVDAEAALAAAREREQSRGELVGAVIAAQERERARVARDLHDQIGQSLTSVLLALRLVERSLGGDDDDARDRIEEVRDLVAEALDESRRLAFELRPTVLDDVGLRPALERLVGDLAARHPLVVALAVDGLTDDDRLTPETETVVYRVVQEALTNVVRHAGAAKVSVSVRRFESGLVVTVVDDGHGFDPAEAEGSLGLAGVRERAALVGGHVTITSSSGQGTTVELEVPGG
jgi:signal transduction histidine kinase